MKTNNEKLLDDILKNKAKRLLSYIHRVGDKEKQLNHIMLHFKDLSKHSINYGYHLCETDNIPKNCLDNDDEY